MPLFFIMEIYEFLENAKQINFDWLKSRLTQIIIENEMIFIDMIKSQWEQGENEEGKAVGTYKPVTQNFYSKINPPQSGMQKIAGRPYNLIWDGDLIKLTSINLEIRDGELILLIDSAASSKNPLFGQIKKEGLVPDPESIFGLQEINLGILSEMTNESIIENFLTTLKIN